MNAPFPGPQGSIVPDYANLPDALKPLTQQKIWCVSTLTPKADGEPDKAPRKAWNPDHHAKTNDPDTWGTFDQALASFEAGKCRAIGFNLLGTNVGLIDPDDVRDPATGEISAWATSLINVSGSYAEFSISGERVHILGEAVGEPLDEQKLPMPSEHGPGQLDAWRGTERYCIVTGCPLPGHDRPFANIDGVMNKAVSIGHEEKRKGKRKPKKEAKPKAGAKKAKTSIPFDELTQADIDELVRNSAPVGDRSDAFWNVARWYFKLKWTADQLEKHLGQHPNGIASRYSGRLREQINAIFEKLAYDPIKAIATVVQRFNDKYMVVNEAGKAVVLQPGFDPVLKRRHFDRLSIRDLQTLYMNEVIEVGLDDKDRPIFKPVSEVWLKHRDRRQYINGITFDPTAKWSPGVLNLWEGYAVKPAPGDWSHMRAHIKDVICDDDPIRFHYLLGWMARMLQHPAEQGEVAVVMQGGEGTGKGTLAKALMKITGHHGLAISNAKHLIGNFNAHLRDAVFLFADEAFFAGDRAHIGVLKSLITEPYLTVEAKFANTIQAPNFLHVMMASNEEWVVPASRDARRFFVLEVPDVVQNDHTYFARIWSQMADGGLEAMLHDLLAYDLTGFNVRAVPTTAGLQRQRKFSLPVPEAWWLSCLERGYVFRSKLGLESEFARWHEQISNDLLFDSYSDFARSRGERRPLQLEDLGRFVTAVGGSKKRWRHGVVGEHIADVTNNFGGVSRKAETVKATGRTYGYLLGSLDEARAAFVSATKLAVAWDSDGVCEDDGDA